MIIKNAMRLSCQNRELFLGPESKHLKFWFTTSTTFMNFDISQISTPCQNEWILVRNENIRNVIFKICSHFVIWLKFWDKSMNEFNQGVKTTVQDMKILFTIKWIHEPWFYFFSKSLHELIFRTRKMKNDWKTEWRKNKKQKKCDGCMITYIGDPSI